MKGEIINVGTEILLGNIYNTHSKYLSEKLSSLGIDIYYHTSVGDNPGRIKETLKTSLNRSDLVILTGGLGPTKDDVTKECVAELLDKRLIFDKNVMDDIDKFFKNRRKKYVDSVKKQSYIIEGSKVLKNEVGTAPGLFLEENRKTIIILPGPPKELENVFIKAEKILASRADNIIKSKTLRFTGIGESDLEEKIIDLIENQTNPTIAPYVKEGHVEIRVTAKANGVKQAEDMLEDTIKQIEDKIGRYLFSKEDESIEEVVYKLLKERGLKIGFCESCTGGLISSRLTRISGSSAVFDRGIVTYSNTAKIEEVNVNHKDLEEYGAVSKQVALSMAKGLYNKSDIGIAVSVTGIAGPTGGTDKKPVGLVYFGVASKDVEYTTKRIFIGTRDRIQNKTANTAFELVIKLLKEDL
ncbi:competence/damage-inducible protein A [Clostridiaceae bacterium M8S5]|nr:competence/damage-inducible protein A [Clostridiaceae bacterium M8S5]